MFLVLIVRGELHLNGAEFAPGNVTLQVYLTNNVKHKDLKRRRVNKYIWEAMLTWIKFIGDFIKSCSLLVKEGDSCVLSSKEEPRSKVEPTFFEGVDGNYMQLIDELEESLTLNEYHMGSPRKRAPNIGGEKFEKLKPRVTSILNLVESNESLLEQMQQHSQRADEGNNNVAKGSTRLCIVPNG